MKRLTRKSLEYKDTWIADGSLSNIEGVVRGNAIDRLAELEDVLESWHIESLEELKTRLHDCQVYHLENNSNETLIHNLKNELADLQHKLEVAEKALELAVDNIIWGPAKQGECNCQEHDNDCSWFLKRKAEKELKGE